MRRIAFSIAITCALALLTALGGAAPSYAAPPARAAQAAAQPSALPLCEFDNPPGLCWRDPSDGGPGTVVVNSGFGTDAARTWTMFTDHPRCFNGVVTNTPPCPFTGGSGLNFKYQNSRIVIVQNFGSSLCAGSSGSDQMAVKMHACDSILGTTELSSVFVEQTFPTHFRLISVVWSDRCSCTEFVTGSGTNNNPLFIDINENLPGQFIRWIGAVGS